MSVFAGDNPGVSITKIMSLSREEFEVSFARVVGDVAAVLAGADARSSRYEVPLPSGYAVVTVEPLEPQMMGGLVALPRCQVSIDFAEAPLSERQAFLNRFDRAFQRGGG